MSRRTGDTCEYGLCPPRRSIRVSRLKLPTYILVPAKITVLIVTPMSRYLGSVVGRHLPSVGYLLNYTTYSPTMGVGYRVDQNFTAPSASMYALGNFSSAHASALLTNDEGLQQRLAQFNRSSATTNPVAPHRRRTASWADPFSADGLEIDQDWDLELAQKLSSSPVSAPGPGLGAGQGLSAISSASQASRSPALSRRSSTGRGRKRQQPFFLRRKR